MSGFSTGEYNSAKYKLLYALNNTRILPIVSDPTDEDTDGDNCSDYDEKNIFKTSPLFNEKQVWEQRINKMNKSSSIHAIDDVDQTITNASQDSNNVISNEDRETWWTAGKLNAKINCYGNALGIKYYGNPYYAFGTDSQKFIDAIRFDIGYYNLIEVKYIIDPIPQNFYLVAFKICPGYSYHIMPCIDDIWYDSQPITTRSKNDSYITQEKWGSYYNSTHFVAVRKDWYNHV
jgi:hypothetical protein